MSDEPSPTERGPVSPGSDAAAPRPRMVQLAPGAPPVPLADGRPEPRYAAPLPPPAPGAPRRADRRPATLATVALILAIAGAVFALLPVLGLLTVPLLVAALVCALIALISARHGGTGRSIAALAVSCLGGAIAIGSLAVTVLLGGLGGWGPAQSSPGSVAPHDGRDIAPHPGEDAVAGADQELRVLESAVGRAAYDEGTWWYTVIIDNPNPDAVFAGTDVLVDLIGTDGVVLDTVAEYVSIHPGVSAITGVFFDQPADISVTGVRAELPPAADGWIVPTEQLGTLVASDVRLTTTAGATTVTGTVTSTFLQPPTYAGLTVVLRDASGAIVAAEWTYLEDTRHGAPADFEVWFPDPVPADATVEVYPSL